MTTKFVFVSGNEDKIRDAREILDGQLALDVLRLDLTEIQGQTREIAEQKCMEAMKSVDDDVIVEDTALCLEALGGMPGPYIKWFMQSLGPQHLHRLLADFSSRKATVVSTVAWGRKGPRGPNVKLFQAYVSGQIVAPRGFEGDRGGWDPCFEPDHQPLTYGQMSPAVRRLYCARQQALRQFLAHLRST